VYNRPVDAHTKKDLLIALLAGAHAFIQVDGRAEGVELPEHLKTDPAVVLQLGYQLAVPIVDLTVDDAGVSATLSFRRTPFHCKIPWPAIYGMAGADGRGMLFPDDVPPDLEEARTAARPPEPSPAQGAGKPAGKPASANGRPRPSHLKLVK